MVNETIEQKPQGTIEQRMKIELLHPINHDFIQYSRGLHELDESLAKLFLTYKEAVSRKPICREFVAGQAPVARGTTKPSK